MAQKPEWPPHDCNSLCREGWHVERLTTPDDMNPDVLREMLIDDWQAAEMRLDSMRTLADARIEYLLWWRPKQTQQ